MSYIPQTTFCKWAYLAMRKGSLSRVRREQEANRLANRGLSRMEANSWFLVRRMERLHGVGKVKGDDEMNELFGIAFTVEGNWFVESCGQAIAVIQGEKGDIHPILRRGRDENRKVVFRPFEQYCDVLGFCPED